MLENLPRNETRCSKKIRKFIFYSYRNWLKQNKHQRIIQSKENIQIYVVNAPWSWPFETSYGCQRGTVVSFDIHCMRQRSHWDVMKRALRSNVSLSLSVRWKGNDKQHGMSACQQERYSFIFIADDNTMKIHCNFIFKNQFRFLFHIFKCTNIFLWILRFVTSQTLLKYWLYQRFLCALNPWYSGDLWRDSADRPVFNQEKKTRYQRDLMKLNCSNNVNIDLMKILGLISTWFKIFAILRNCNQLAYLVASNTLQNQPCNVKCKPNSEIQWNVPKWAR